MIPLSITRIGEVFDVGLEEGAFEVQLFISQSYAFTKATECGHLSETLAPNETAHLSPLAKFPDAESLQLGTLQSVGYGPKNVCISLKNNFAFRLFPKG